MLQDRSNRAIFSLSRKRGYNATGLAQCPIDRGRSFVTSRIFRSIALQVLGYPGFAKSSGFFEFAGLTLDQAGQNDETRSLLQNRYDYFGSTLNNTKKYLNRHYRREFCISWSSFDLGTLVGRRTCLYIYFSIHQTKFYGFSKLDSSGYLNPPSCPRCPNRLTPAGSPNFPSWRINRTPPGSSNFPILLSCARLFFSRRCSIFTTASGYPVFLSKLSPASDVYGFLTRFGIGFFRRLGSISESPPIADADLAGKRAAGSLKTVIYRARERFQARLDSADINFLSSDVSAAASIRWIVKSAS